MQTKKIIGIALAAALVGSMATIAVSARDFVPDDEMANYTKNHTFGIVGSITGWGEQPDVAMTDADEDGILVGVVRDIPAGDYEFKVRADSAWDDSWGDYETDYERTMNSQTNFKISVKSSSDLIVALDTTGKDSVVWPVSYVLTESATPTNYGIVGTINGWGETADLPMYSVKEGLLVGVAKGVTGDAEFKVRTDNKWTETGSWGVYEADYERTMNSQTNCKETFTDPADVMVELNAMGSDPVIYPVSYTVYNGAAATKAVYTGKEKTIEESSTTESSTTESSVTTESSTTESSTEVSKEIEGRDTVVTDYVFFDNSKTKWDEVYAYWWHPDYARTWDLEGNDFGCQKVVNDDGTEGYEPKTFPGTRMTQVVDKDGKPTDIWQIRIPFNAQKIIFSSGKSDEQIHKGEIGYQTADLDFDSVANAGQIYTVDTSVEAAPGRGIEKTKYKYTAGAYSAYDGAFNIEHIGKETSQKEDSKGAETSKKDSSKGSETSKSTGTAAAGTATNAPATGDVAMAAAFIAVLAAALGVIVLAAKKKRV